MHCLVIPHRSADADAATKIRRARSALRYRVYHQQPLPIYASMKALRFFSVYTVFSKTTIYINIILLVARTMAYWYRSSGIFHPNQRFFERLTRARKRSWDFTPPLRARAENAPLLDVTISLVTISLVSDSEEKGGRSPPSKRGFWSEQAEDTGLPCHMLSVPCVRVRSARTDRTYSMRQGSP